MCNLYSILLIYMQHHKLTWFFLTHWSKLSTQSLYCYVLKMKPLCICLSCILYSIIFYYIILHLCLLKQGSCYTSLLEHFVSASPCCDVGWWDSLLKERRLKVQHKVDPLLPIWRFRLHGCPYVTFKWLQRRCYSCVHDLVLSQRKHS